MLKEKTIRFVRNFRTGICAAVRMHPIELLLVLYACAACILWNECSWNDENMTYLILVPVFTLLALAVNLFAGGGPWRKVYWVCWTPIVPLALCCDVNNWAGSVPFIVTLAVLAPLCVLMSRRAVNNRRFVDDATVYVRSGILALFFANVVLGLFGAILFSTVYIFGIDGEWVSHLWIDAIILMETLIAPVLFLMMLDRWLGREVRGSRFLDVLLNWIVTPALLIYLAILWLYILKILVMWTLPEGGVAYMVFGFTILALLVKALQDLLTHRPYNWFFDRFSLYALPAVVLFWVGVVRRVAEYGLTEPRVWLLVCGAVMTICLLLFLSHRTGRYLWVCAAAFVCFAAMVYIPSLEPERLAVRSQAARAARIAHSLGRLTPEGTLLRTPVPQADTVREGEYRRLYEALGYIEYRDRDRFAAFGVETADELLTDLPDNGFRYYVRYGYPSNDADEGQWWTVDAPRDWKIGTKGYQYVYTNLNRYNDPENGYYFLNDTLCIRLGKTEPLLLLSGRDLLDKQLAKTGCSIEELRAEPDSVRCAKFLDYEENGLRILFNTMYLETIAGDTHIDDVSVELVMTRE